MDKVLFQGMPTQAVTVARQRAVTRSHAPGCQIENSEGFAIHLILKGQATTYTLSRFGKKIAVGFAVAGDILVGEGLSEFAGENNWRHFEAETSCQTISFTPAEINRLVHEYPSFNSNLRRALAFGTVLRDRRIARLEEDKNRLYDLVDFQDRQLTSAHQNVMELPFFKRNIDHIKNLARQPEPLLIVGEKGIGKHRLGRIINDLAPVPGRIFMSVDFLKPSTYKSDESERQLSAAEVLFGYRDELESRPGVVDFVREGTLLINGFGTLPPDIQRQLWRVAQRESATKNKGSETGMRLIVLSSHHSEKKETSSIVPEIMESLNKRQIVIPPLRRRKKDIPVLVNFYVDFFNRELGKDIKRVSSEAMKELLGNKWWGNESELKETVKRGVILAARGELQAVHIRSGFRQVGRAGKFNLLNVPRLKKILINPFFPSALQWAAAPFFFILIFLLIFGTREPETNIGSVFIWGWGWPMMVVGAFFWARFWCSICPIGSTSSWLGKIFSQKLTLPPWVEKYSDLLLTAIIIVIIWSELVWDLRQYPQRLGFLLLTIMILALLFSLLFERQVWCSFLCGMGGMSGLFARIAFLELRADRNICLTSCTDHECFAGSQSEEGCPLFRYAPSLVSNQRCRLCMNCVKNCKHGSISLFLRTPGKELWETPATSPWAAVFIFSIMGSLFLELSLGSALWQRFHTLLGGEKLISVSLAMLFLVSIVNLSLGLVSLWQAWILNKKPSQCFAEYGLAYLPLAVGAYCAFHLYYMLTLGGQVPMLIAEYGRLDLFGQFSYSISPATIYKAQKVALATGCLGTLIVLSKLSTNLKITQLRRAGFMIAHVGLTLLLSISFLEGMRNHFFI